MRKTAGTRSGGGGGAGEARRASKSARKAPWKPKGPPKGIRSSAGTGPKAPPRDDARKAPPAAEPRKGAPRKGPPRDETRKAPPAAEPRKGAPRDDTRKGAPRKGPPRDETRKAAPAAEPRKGAPRDDARKGRDDARKGAPRDDTRKAPPAASARKASAERGARPAPPPLPPRPKKQELSPLPDGPPRSGTVAIIGRPNVGKSTLLNAALEMPLAIVSPTPQTTRDALLGVVQHGTAEIALLDTPGIFAAQNALDRVMMRAANEAAEGADVVVFVTALARDAAQSEGVLRAHRSDLSLLKGLPHGSRVIVVVNKIDQMRDKRRLLSILSELGAVREDIVAVVPISALREDGVRRVLDEIAKVLPEGPRRYGDDDVTDRPARFFAREYVREQVLLATREEVPHSVAVTIDAWEEGAAKRASRIAATIHVERDGQKRILVGAGGAMLTRIGSQARARLAELVGGPVHLDLFVRITEGWRSKAGKLADLGYGAAAEGESETNESMIVAELESERGQDEVKS